MPAAAAYALRLDPFAPEYDEIIEGFGGIIGFPTTFIVTQDGKIYQKYLGLRTNKRALIEKDIETLLASNTVTRAGD